MQIRELHLNKIINNPMEIALNLARTGLYTVSPNPMVGAVLLQDDRLVGYGAHLYKGDDHAEIKAINMAGTKAKGAKLYLNLEPCFHYGATPPCVDKIIASQVSEVHFSSIDPNPLVQGKSIEKLKQAGIKLFIGEKQEEAEKLNEIFYHFMSTKRPFVIAKWAMTMDGKIATNKDSKWISNEQSRLHAHALRNSVDAILVGNQTAIVDNPALNVRREDLVCTRSPLRLIIANKRQPPAHFIDCENTYIIHSNKQGHKYLNSLTINELDNGDLDLHDLLEKLGDLSITSLLIEGGGYTLAKFLEANLLNKFYCYLAAKFVGGKNSISPFNQDIGIDFINDAKCAEIETIKQFNNNILIQGNFRKITCSPE